MKIRYITECQKKLYSLFGEKQQQQCSWCNYYLIFALADNNEKRATMMTNSVDGDEKWNG